MRQLWVQSVMRFKSWFMSRAAASGSWTTVKSDVSSAKSLTLHLKFSVKSFIYTRKKRGPRIEPWGTPAVIFPHCEALQFRTVRCMLSAKKLSTSQRSWPEIPHRSSSKISASCHTLSNALDISRYTERTSRGGLQSKASNTESIRTLSNLCI